MPDLFSVLVTKLYLHLWEGMGSDTVLEEVKIHHEEYFCSAFLKSLFVCLGFVKRKE